MIDICVDRNQEYKSDEYIVDSAPFIFEEHKK
jgi:hypothetical protein